MNKKYFVLSLFYFVIFNFCSFAQEKLFTETINKGRQETEAYYWKEVEFKKGVNIADDVKEYAKTHDICILGYTSLSKKKGKSWIKYYPKCWFLPNSEIVDYVYSNIRHASVIPDMPPFSEIKRKAGGWFPNWYLSHVVLKFRELDFFSFHEMFWSGDVVDGLIDGNGVGVFMDGDKEKTVYVLSGTFKKGFPVGKYSSCSYTLVPTYGEYGFGGAESRSATLSEFRNGEATYAYDGYTALISPDGSGVLDPKYIAFRDSIKRTEEMALEKKAREEEIAREKKARESDPQYNWEKSHTIYFSSTYRKDYHSFSFSEHHSDRDRFKMKQALSLASDAFLGFGTPYGDYYAPAGQFYAEELDDYLASGDKDNYSSTTWFVLNLLKQLPELKKSRILADRLSHSCLKHWWLKDYFDLYGNYGSLTEEEINKWEIDYILNNRAEVVVASYNKYFPKGKRKGYSKEDFKKDYVPLFIDEATRVIASDELPRLSLSFDGASLLSGDARVDFRRKYLEQLKTENYPDADFALDCLHFMDAYYLSASADTTTYVLYQRDTEGAYLLDAKEYVKSLQQGLKAAAPIKERLITIKDICQKKEDKIRHWYTGIDNINRDARIHRQGLREKHNEEFKVFKAEMCEKCRIDGSKTTTPKGWDSGNPDLIFGRPAQSDEAGKVVLVNGEEIKWKYVKYDSGTIIEARGAYYGDYKTVDEMMSAIIRMCNDKWR